MNLKLNKDGILCLGDIYDDIVPAPSKYDPTDQEHWTPWRKANFEFLSFTLSLEPSGRELLDIGAGPQYFFEATKRFPKMAIDFYPYPQIDVCFDFTQTFPVRDHVFDIVLLSNVLEHVYNPRFLLSHIHRILRPDGLLIAMVPFWAGIHQAPYDYLRYTEFELKRLLCEHSFSMGNFQPWGSPLYQAHGYLHAAQVSYRKHWAYGFRVLHRLNLFMIVIMKRSVDFLERWIQLSTGIGRRNKEFMANVPMGYMFTAKKLDYLSEQIVCSAER